MKKKFQNSYIQCVAKFYYFSVNRNLDFYNFTVSSLCTGKWTSTPNLNKYTGCLVSYDNWTKCAKGIVQPVSLLLITLGASTTASSIYSCRLSFTNETSSINILNAFLRKKIQRQEFCYALSTWSSLSWNQRRCFITYI